MALRLRGEALTAIDPAAARSDLDTAQRMLEEIGARNDVGKTLVARAMLHRAAGEEAEAHSLLHRALAVFETLGTGGPVVPRRESSICERIPGTPERVGRGYDEGQPFCANV